MAAISASDIWVPAPAVSLPSTIFDFDFNIYNNQISNYINKEKLNKSNELHKKETSRISAT